MMLVIWDVGHISKKGQMRNPFLLNFAVNVKPLYLMKPIRHTKKMGF